MLTSEMLLSNVTCRQDNKLTETRAISHLSKIIGNLSNTVLPRGFHTKQELVFMAKVKQWLLTVHILMPSREVGGYMPWCCLVCVLVVFQCYDYFR